MRKQQHTFGMARWLFLRALGVVYLLAFVSLWLQIEGLIGSNGILPATTFLEQAYARLGLVSYWSLPTLAWLCSSDVCLHLLCALGVVFAGLVIYGVGTAPALFLLWVLYLSLVTVGRVFLGYQWDNLLLETGFLAIFLAPLQWRDRLSPTVLPSRTAMWLLNWLLFRLMFTSGVVKLSSGDTVWRNLTALTYHYATQPLPTWVAWYVHQLPMWFHKATAVAMFVCELLVPWGIFAPRRWRHATCLVLVGLQVFIALTGNYGFFNLLTIVLCLLLLDDQVWPRRWQIRLNFAAEHSYALSLQKWSAWLTAPLAALILALSVVYIAQALHLQAPWPRPVFQVVRWVAPFRTINSYGLFANMTTRRPEIIIEGSNDGSTWQPYGFRWKPGDVQRRPRFVAPYQPRLDWQLWFAALGRYHYTPWFKPFLNRLLQGQPEVLALLRHNPFPEAPPRYVRAVLYDYQFTILGQDGWWQRKRLGLYAPVHTRGH